MNSNSGRRMRKSIRGIVLISLVMILSFGAIAQSEDLKLLGEGANNVVRLAWLGTQWPENIVGFIVKRKANGQAWEQLTPQPIRPGVDPSGDLSLVESSPEARQRLQQHLQERLASGRIKVINEEVYLKKLLQDDGFFEGQTLQLIFDYKLTLISGFGFVDRAPKREGSYTYGIFAVDKNDDLAEAPLQTFEWTYGRDDRLSLDFSFKHEKIKSDNGYEIRLQWKVPSSEYTSKEALGVNIYKKEEGVSNWSKINDKIMVPNIVDKSAVVSYADKDHSGGGNFRYKIVPVSIFQTEGEGNVANVEIPELYNITSQPVISNQPKLAEKGITIEWRFPQEDEGQINGFYLERQSEQEEDFTRVSGLIDPGKRTFNDKNGQPQYYTYKAVAERKDGELLESNPAYIYFYVNYLVPAPEALKAEYLNQGDEEYVRLQWNPKSVSDTTTVGYKLYIDDAFTEGFVHLGSIPLITGNEYQYKVEGMYGEKLKFSIKGVSKTFTESGYSNSVEVWIPSKYLPPVQIADSKTLNNKLSLQWRFSDDVKDLAGFRIYSGDTIVEDEKSLDRLSRQWTSSGLSSGTYRFRVAAVTFSGKEKFSKQVRINIK